MVVTEKAIPMARSNQLIGLPSHIHPLSLVALGFPEKRVAPTRRFKPERVHFNHW